MYSFFISDLRLAVSHPPDVVLWGGRRAPGESPQLERGDTAGLQCPLLSLLVMSPSPLTP